MRLLLIRHGETPSNLAGALDTARPGADLTAVGRRQAAALPAVLESEPIAAVYASLLARTQQTAQPLARARGLTAEIIEGIEEIGAGSMELATDRDSIVSYLDTIAAWVQGDIERVMPGGPDGSAFLARYDAALARIVAAYPPETTVAVFSHGAAIRCFATIRAGGGLNRPAGELVLHNTGVVILVGDPAAGWRVERWQTDPLGGR